MNIFASDDDPKIAAKNLDDKRVVKMALETAQMISAVAHRYAIEGPWYKLTHANHPCTKWAGDCYENLMWLVDHGIALCSEYEHRFGKKHKSLPVICAGFKFAHDLSTPLPQGSRQPFANCTPYKSTPSVTAYRQYLNDKWQADRRPAKWTNSSPPLWYVTHPPKTKD